MAFRVVAHVEVGVALGETSKKCSEILDQKGVVLLGLLVGGMECVECVIHTVDGGIERVNDLFEVDYLKFCIIVGVEIQLPDFEWVVVNKCLEHFFRGNLYRRRHGLAEWTNCLEGWVRNYFCWPTNNFNNGLMLIILDLFSDSGNRHPQFGSSKFQKGHGAEFNERVVRKRA